MGNGDNRQGSDRWRGSQDWDRNDSGRRGQGGGGDRGFFERAGEQVRSWFGDDDDPRRSGGSGSQGREQSWRGGSEDNRGRDQSWRGGGDDGRGRDQSWRGGGDESWGRDQGWGRAERWSGDESFGGGWGNQAPRSGGRDRWTEESRGGGRSEWSDGRQGSGREERGNWGGGSGDRCRDRGQSGGGWSMWGGGGEDRSRDHDQGRDGSNVWGRENAGRGHHDPHYAEWRQRQIDQLDRDYDEYRREHQSKFGQEFHGWREKRQGQRQSMGRVTEQMEVIGSDGQHIGKVDKVSGERIILAKDDPNSAGMHHSVPCSWIESVDERVHVNRTAEQAMREWKDEERSRALFEDRNSGSEGPHMLNRSFSGTYSDRDDR